LDPSVAYLGPPGTFSHAAARRAFPERAAWLAGATIDAVFESVSAGRAAFGVVPIENSTEGSVDVTLDCLVESALLICRELVLEIEHCLVAKHRDRSRYGRISSHPQALAQCRGWLARELPNAELVAASSTARAAEDAAGSDDLAAISSKLAAELYGLEVVAEGIQDRASNATRFVVVARQDAPPSGRDRTSVAFSLPHQKGALRQALEIFDGVGLNLSRIQSRPLPGRLWEYRFFADFEGHRADPGAAAALEELAARTGSLRVLGSYPRAF
jgi:chorismate mutase / prephenate dehydratase